MNTSMKPARTLVILLVPVLTTGCQGLVEPLADPPDLVGVVVDVRDSPVADGRVYELSGVEYAREPHEEEAVDWGRAVIGHASPLTRCFLDERGAVTPIGCSKVSVGDRLGVWFHPRQRAVLSSPPSYPADQIVIMRE